MKLHGFICSHTAEVTQSGDFALMQRVRRRERPGPTWKYYVSPLKHKQSSRDL